MSTVAKGWQSQRIHPSSTLKFLIRLILLAIVDVFALLLQSPLAMMQLVSRYTIGDGPCGDGHHLVPDLWPMRWMSPDWAAHPYPIYPSFTQSMSRSPITVMGIGIQKSALELLQTQIFAGGGCHL